MGLYIVFFLSFSSNFPLLSTAAYTLQLITIACGTITPIYKSEDRNTVGNYRGITIQLVTSELYSIVLMTRIE